MPYDDCKISEEKEDIFLNSVLTFVKNKFVSREVLYKMRFLVKERMIYILKKEFKWENID